MIIDIKSYNFAYNDNDLYDLTAKLCGFHYVLGFNEDETVYNIRGIGPRIEYTSCQLAELPPNFDSNYTIYMS